MRPLTPRHGKGFELGLWQVVRVFKRAPGIGEDAWVQELGLAHKRPEEGPDDTRRRLLEERERPEDVRLEAV